MALGLVGKLTVMFGADFQGFDKAMKKAQKSVSRFGAKMERTGQTLTRNVTLPLAGLGIAAVKMASDFEETDSKFKKSSLIKFGLFKTTPTAKSIALLELFINEKCSEELFFF